MSNEANPPDRHLAPDGAVAEPEDPGSGGFFHRNRALVTHWALFVVILGLLFALSEWASYWVNLRFAEWTAGVMALLLNAVGIEAQTAGQWVINPVCRFKIIGECTAYYPMAIFAAAVLSYPCAWRRRIVGVLVGVPAVLAINQVRLLSLCYVYHNHYDVFETMHIVVWQSLIIFFTVLMWIFWVVTFARRDESGPA